MAGFGDDYVRTIMAAGEAGQKDRQTAAIQKFGAAAAQGDPDAMNQMYQASPEAGSQFETYLMGRDQKQAQWHDYVQEQAGKVAYSVLSAPPEQKLANLQQGIQMMTGLAKRDPMMAPILQQWGQLAQSGDMAKIDQALNSVLENTLSYKDRLTMVQPKSETERMWAIINGGDTSSPAYRMAYSELFGKERTAIDPISGQLMTIKQPVPDGILPPGARPRAPVAPPQAPAAPSGTIPFGAAAAGPAPAPAAPVRAPAPTPAPAPRPAPPRGTMPFGAATAAPPAAPTGAPQVTLPSLGGPPPLNDADFGPGKPVPPPPMPTPSPVAPRALPMVGEDGRPLPTGRTDAFGNPIDPNMPTAAERRQDAKTNKASYQEQRKLAAAGAADAQSALVQAQNFQRLNNKVNAKGSGSLGTGGLINNVPFVSDLAAWADSDITQMKSIVSKMIPSQRPPGSGTMSDGDAKMFQSGLFGTDKPWAANNAIATGIVSASKDALGYQRFLDLYYKKNGNADEANSLWMQYVTENPIFDPTIVDQPVLNRVRVPWQTYFSQRGVIDPTEAPKATAPTGPSSPNSVPASKMQEMIKNNPGRFQPLN